MALHEQNRMLQILHKNGVDRKYIKIIMNDLKDSNIFSEEECDEECRWENIEKKATIWFSDLKPQEKLEAIKKLDIDDGQYDELDTKSDKRRNQFFYDTEKRVQEKMKEMGERGLAGPDIIDEEPVEFFITRYGRSPLHEAIVMRDIRLVKRYIKEGLYLNALDNNGHTPMEMAYYEGYKEAIAVFRSHKKKK